MTKPLCSVLLGLVVSSPAFADDVVCDGLIGADKIDANVLVIGDCTLDGTVIRGDVLVDPNTSLTATGVFLRGSIRADGADVVVVDSSTISGGVELAGLVGAGSELVDSMVRGNIDVRENVSPVVVDGNRTGGNVQADGNTGGVTITDNMIKGDLQCRDNLPAPDGGNNVVGGDAKDQCVAL